MNKMLLIRTDGTYPPGAYAFEDRITGKQYRDTHTPFDERVKEVIRDREANRRLFTDERKVDPTYVALEISEQICARLNGDSRYCTDGTLPTSPKSSLHKTFQAVKDKTCPICGEGDMKPIQCPTCSSVRIVRYECRKPGCGGKIVL